jgi:23S rRNA (guanosine2251-2'-O)-methyltransferase
MHSIILIAHNLRSTHNVGSLLRTADGLGIDAVYLTGYTPYPSIQNDQRLPHIHQKLTRQIHKTALGAELTNIWQHRSDISAVISDLKNRGYTVTALEQTPKSISLHKFSVPNKVAIIVGREVEGLEPEVIDQTDNQLEIPMFGQKESFNVAQAAAMAMYALRF